MVLRYHCDVVNRWVVRVMRMSEYYMVLRYHCDWMDLSPSVHRLFPSEYYMVLRYHCEPSAVVLLTVDELSEYYMVLRYHCDWRTCPFAEPHHAVAIFKVSRYHCYELDIERAHDDKMSRSLWCRATIVTTE